MGTGGGAGPGEDEPVTPRQPPRDPAPGGRPRSRPAAPPDGTVLVLRGTRAGVVLGALGGLVSGAALVLLGPGEDAGLLVLVAVVLSAAVGGLTGAVGASLLRTQLGTPAGVRPVPVVVTTALVALLALALLGAVLSSLWAPLALAGAGCVLALVRVTTLARTVRARRPLPPVV